MRNSRKLPRGDNCYVSRREVIKIQHLDEFDLVMLVSEIHEHGWYVARCTLEKMPDGRQVQMDRTGEDKCPT